MPLNRRGLIRRLLQNAAAIIDQGLFSTAGFLVAAVLARTLSPGEFSRYSVIWAMVLLATAIHGAVVREPMAVLGPSVYARQRWRYVAQVVRIGILVAAVLGIALSLASTLLAGRVPPQRWTLAFVIPMVVLTYLTLLLLRRAPYVWRFPRFAAEMSAGYVVLLAPMLLLFAGYLTLDRALVILVVTASVVTTSGYVLMRRSLTSTDEGAQPLDILEIAGRHWEYGRWAAGTNVLMWAPTNLTLLVLSLSATPGVVASFKVLSVLARPALQIQVAMATLALPALAGSQRITEKLAIRRQLVTSYVGLALVYLAVCVVFGGTMVRLVFGARFSAVSPLLVLIALAPIFSALMFPTLDFLRSIRRTDLIFWAFLASTGAGALLSIILIAELGLLGAVLCPSVYYALQAGALQIASIAATAGRAEAIHD